MKNKILIHCSVIFFLLIESCVTTEINDNNVLQEEVSKVQPKIENYENLQIIRSKYIYFIFKAASWNHNINILYEVGLEDNVPIFNRIDYINGKKVIFQKIILDEIITNHFFYSLVYGFRKPNGNMSEYLAFRTINNETEIACVVGMTPGIVYIANDMTGIYETMEQLSTERERLKQYTGTFNFEMSEVLFDTTIDNNNLGDKYHNPENPMEEISIVFTGIGNLYMEGKINDTIIASSSFYKNENDSRILLIAGDGGGFSTESYYYFENDYLIYYFATSKWQGSYGYKIYYKKATNGT